MTEREIDAAIDRAARDLMDVDTDAAFRARVTARLQRPARRLLVPRLLAGALTAAAFTAALVWMRPSSSEGPSSAPVAVLNTPSAGVPSSPRASARPDRPAAVPSPHPATTTRERRAVADSIQRGAIVAAVAEAPANGIDPLTAIDPIDVDPLPETAIAPSEIVVAPLSPISEMQISPLYPQTARD